MISHSLLRNTISVLLLVFVGFAAGFIASPALGQTFNCTRTQTRCSYRVEWWMCTRGCGCTDEFGFKYTNCCYQEGGTCINNQYMEGYSTICGGQCPGYDSL